MEKLSCCINTYKRPELLIKLLECLEKQKLKTTWSLEVIIVDNDEDKSAQESVQKFKVNSSLNVKYFTQPLKNISLTRNKAVTEASGDYLFFIDDDGFPIEEWIFLMMETLEKYSADGVFGSVIPFFDEDVPNWVHKVPFYKRLIQPTGENSRFYRTGNCLVKASWVNKIPGPFDPNLGLTGGEDSDLFNKLRDLGAKLIFCKEAIVYDYVPKDRAKISWLIKRNFRTGITTIDGRIKKSRNKLFTKLYYFFRSLILILICALMSLITSPIRYISYTWAVKAASYSGHLFSVFNYKFEGY